MTSAAASQIVSETRDRDETRVADDQPLDPSRSDANNRFPYLGVVETKEKSREGRRHRRPMASLIERHARSLVSFPALTGHPHFVVIQALNVLADRRAGTRSERGLTRFRPQFDVHHDDPRVAEAYAHSSVRWMRQSGESYRSASGNFTM
jgi:hypothetical protein